MKDKIEKENEFLCCGKPMELFVGQDSGREIYFCWNCHDVYTV